MNSSRPYLVRAFFEWILDNDLTPYLVVDTQDENVEVPESYIEDNRIILNISPDSVRDFLISNDSVEFFARFGGVEHSIYAPMQAIQAIYAKENGRGMVFNKEDEDEDDSGGGGSRPRRKGQGKPALSIVK